MCAQSINQSINPVFAEFNISPSVAGAGVMAVGVSIPNIAAIMFGKFITVTSHEHNGIPYHRISTACSTACSGKQQKTYQSSKLLIQNLLHVFFHICSSCLSVISSHVWERSQAMKKSVVYVTFSLIGRDRSRMIDDCPGFVIYPFKPFPLEYCTIFPQLPNGESREKVCIPSDLSYTDVMKHRLSWHSLGQAGMAR